MIYTQLYDWQKAIVDKLQEKRSFGLFLDMGLGKTPLSLSLGERHHCTRVLVITLNPKALEKETDRGSWQNWLTKYADGAMQVYGKKDEPEYRRNTPAALVINYESLYDRKQLKLQNQIVFSAPLKKFLDACAGQNVLLILDESHKIKDSKTTQTKTIYRIRNYLRACSNLYTFLLTGTPFSTGFIDLYNQLSFMGCPMRKSEFKDRFCVTGNVYGLLGWQQPIVGYKNIDKLFSLVHDYAVTIKSDDVVDLPDQIFVDHFCPKNEYFDLLTKKTLTSTKFTTLNAKRSAIGVPYIEDPSVVQSVRPNGSVLINPWFRDINFPKDTCRGDTPALLWLRARQLSIGFQSDENETIWYDISRINAIRNFLEEKHDNYVLFYNYYAEFYALFNMLEELGYNIDVYNGEIKSTKFYERYVEQDCDKRMSNKKNVILANFASGSTGMNWQQYNKCIVASIPLYKDWAQGIKRVHRIGSKEPVFYYIFRSDNWLDNDMWEALQTSQDYSQDMFNQKLNKILQGEV